MKKVCIIGGAGFVGSHLARRYNSLKYKVTVIDDLSRKLSDINLGSLDKNIAFIKMDISKKNSKELLKKIFKKTDLIFHCAAQVAVTTSLLKPMRDFEVNLLGSINILEAMRISNPNAIIFYSSTNKVYGNLEELTLSEGKNSYDFKNLKGISESYKLDFHTPYGCSKGSADQYFLDYARYYGLKAVVFRKSCIYGPHQFGVEDQGWLSWFAIAALLEKKITIYGNGKQVRDVLYIDDLINAYQLAYKNINKAAGNVFNIGGGYENRISILDAIKKISILTNNELKINFAQTRNGDQKIYISNNDKAKKYFDWAPKVNIENGLSKMLSWIRLNKKTFS